MKVKLGDSEIEEGYKLEDSESLVEENDSCKEEGIYCVSQKHPD